MSNATLIAHAGAEIVERSFLDTLSTPQGTATWHPVAHSEVVNEVYGRLGEAGFRIAREQHAVYRNGDRYFGTLDLDSPLVDGVKLAVGIRNSVDKSLPFGFCAGSRVFVCDNLAFHSDLIVKRKHTRFGQARFGEAIVLAIRSLSQFREQEAARIEYMQRAELTPIEADSLILQSYERGIVSSHDLPKIIAEWRQPSFEEHKDQNRFCLLQAFTQILGKKPSLQPQKYAAQTIALQSLIGGHEERISLNPGTELVVQNAV